MINRPPIAKIYIATKSPVKHQAVQAVLSKYSSFYPSGDALVGVEVQPEINPAQPVNSGFQCTQNRLQALRKIVQEQGVDIDSSEYLFLSIESGIVTKEDSPAQDVCYVQGQRGGIALESFSYPIEIPSDWFDKWISTDLVSHELGYTTTFGDYIASQIEGVDTKNWMAHDTFGNQDRNTQIQDVLSSLLGKFMLEAKVAYYPDFPKEGVTFKDLSFVIGDPELLKILVNIYFLIKEHNLIFKTKVMGQEIRARGWDKKITKVIGFDARGFIYGPLIAQEIGAGFVSKFTYIQAFN